MYSFKTLTGEIVIDHERCKSCRNKPCIAVCPADILKNHEERPVLAQEPAAVQKGKCIECLACELECRLDGEGALEIILPLPER